MVPYRSSTPPDEILCGDSRQNFNHRHAMPDQQNLISPNLCQNTTVSHGEIQKLKYAICMQKIH